MTKKMTKRAHFEFLLTLAEVQANPETVEFIKHELELLAKKNSAEKKPTAVQQANAVLKEAILEGMEAKRLYTITEMIKEIPACAELSNQRVSAVVRQMYDSAEPTIEKVVEKRRSYFRKVEKG